MFSLCYSYHKSSFLLFLRLEQLVQSGSAAATLVDDMHLGSFSGTRGWTSFTAGLVSCDTGTLQLLCWAAATACDSCSHGRRWSPSSLFGQQHGARCVPMHRHVRGCRRRRKPPISRANLENMREAGRPERANTSLQGEPELSILPAQAAQEIQLQPNEEWADLPSASLLLFLLHCSSCSLAGVLGFTGGVAASISCHYCTASSLFSPLVWSFIPLFAISVYSPAACPGWLLYCCSWAVKYRKKWQGCSLMC